jgi:hypothetical protein
MHSTAERTSTGCMDAVAWRQGPGVYLRFE